ncbi:Flp family type IVb pilin [Rhizobium oryzicola]|uniref:Flp family type IVb pilin n=1 Tax=Rhizobium oryzicola TaxID=1232668 RepID=A0ABT8T0U1_9HYPH|nr:Flp family type IVb pilin [Rhizobium oryzicola]MDO1584135.1 Flp family type IVb pilin [Rhizobium oryzicola]
MYVLRRLFSNREGATAVEYGIVVAIICGMLIAGFTLMSDKLLEVFNYLATFLKA